MRPAGDDDATADLGVLDFYNTETSSATEESVAIDMAQLQQQQPPSDLHGPMSSGPMMATATPSTASAGATASGSMSAGSMSATVGFGGFGVLRAVRAQPASRATGSRIPAEPEVS